VVEARLSASAQGVFQAYVNGAAASDDVLSPGWSSYEWRLRYRSYDVTSLVAGHDTVTLGMALGNGWHRGRLGWNGNRNHYGSELGALAQLDVRFADGATQTIGTDESWTAGPSDVLVNDLYDGETIDARLTSDAWLEPGFTGHSVGVHPAKFDPGTLTAYVGPPVRRMEERRPVRIWTSPAGKTLVDFGQNLVGWLKFTVSGAAGEEIVLKHAEVLEHDELGTRPLRTAVATDRLILSGGSDFLEPTFTFHGFRYAEITGWPGELTEDSLVAVVVHSDMQRTGYFECSDELLNQLHSNVVWGQRGNFVDVPTDCPQRDERLGWTGDLAAFAPTAVFNYQVAGFLGDWLADLAVEQTAARGMVPFAVPDLLKFEEHPTQFPAPESTAVWSDAAVWVPWAMWQAYGDRPALAEAFPAMAAHVTRVETLVSASGLWDRGFQFGDWLDPTAPPDEPFKAKADTGVVATACLYRSAVTTAAAAAVLGRGEEVEHFTARAEDTRRAFNEHYVTDAGRVLSDCPTVYALAITFGLLEDPVRQRAGDRLAELVAGNGYRIATGFAGTPYISDAL
ncbi:MAG: family 78 glycoside hydrolase catalytic domain, partial [Janthinobacterium lividum]